MGSEAGKGERKLTESRVLKTGKKAWKQAGKKGKTQEAKAESGHRESSWKAEPGREGKEGQKAE